MVKIIFGYLDYEGAYLINYNQTTSALFFFRTGEPRHRYYGFSQAIYLDWKKNV